MSLAGGYLENELLAEFAGSSIKGGDGNDILRGGTGDDLIDGGAGNDRIAGEDGNDVLHGGLGADVLDGGNGDDQLFADADGYKDPTGLDTLYGGRGDDVLTIGAGDNADGGSGTDTLFIDLSHATAGSGLSLDALALGGTGSNGSAWLKNIEQLGSIVGSAYADTISVGDLAHDKADDGSTDITAGAGNDIVTAGRWDDVIGGGTGNDSIDAGGGNNRVFGDAGDDKLTSGDGNDFIYGGSGADTISAGAGDDRIDGGGHEGSTKSDRIGGGDGDDVILAGWDDVVDGGHGYDTLSLAYAGAAPVHANLAAGILANGGTVARIEYVDRLTLGSGADYVAIGDIMTAGGDAQAGLYGEAGNDHLTGGKYGDILDGGSGDDHLTGLAGDDRLSGGSGNDVLDGGSGNDTVSYADSGRGIHLDLALTAAQAVGDRGADTLISVENVVDSPNADAISGSDSDNVFTLSGGDDRVDGRGGNDTVAFDAPESYGLTLSLATASAQDTEFGRLTLRNIENVIGTAADDHLTGSAAANHLQGLGGDDTLSGGGGADILDGGDGNDTILVASASDIAGDVYHGGAGWDELLFTGPSGSADLTVTLATADIESISAVGWSLTMTRDEIMAATNGGFADTIHVTTGGTLDLAHTNFVAYTVDLSNSGNMLYLADNVLDGGATTTVHGGSASDTIHGSTGTDLIDGGGGADVMDGNGGYDTFVVDNLHDVITSGSTGDVQSSVDFTLSGGLENLTLTGSARHGTGDADANSITGTAGNDVLSGGDGDDYLSGGDGNDVLHGNAGRDFLDGGAGNDVLYFEDALHYAVGGAGYDIVYTADSYGGMAGHIGGIEELHLTNGAVSFDDDGFSDPLKIYANPDEGSTIVGGYGSDTILGGTGDDVLNGGWGTDILSGGAGADHFVFDHYSASEIDEIKDYSAAQGDVLDFTPLESDAASYGVSQIDYIGTGSFNGIAGEARIGLHTGYVYFELDIDGDRVSDLMVKIDGATADTAFHFEI